MIPAISVNGLTLSDPTGTRVLDDVSLAVESGSITALTGPSGAGKTLLLWALLGYLPIGIQHVSGNAGVYGTQALSLDSVRVQQFRRNEITFVGQDPGAALPSTMRVSRLVTQMASTAGAASALAALDTLGISPRYLRRRAGQLSGGEQRRVALVRGIYRTTKVLLLDEPFAGLDERRRDQVATLLRERAGKDGVTILLTGHNTEFLGSFCDSTFRIAPAEPASAEAIPPASTSSGLPALSARGLSARTGTDWIFNDIDLDLLPGVITALVGPSGTGKTTLARTLVGLRGHVANADTLTLSDQALPLRISRRRPHHQRIIQYIPQDPLSTLNPMRSVGQTIARPLRLRGVRRTQLPDRVDKLLVEVGLSPEHAERFPRELSGGQRQRVAIARALAAEPTVLICDEITAALDRTTAHAVMDLLVETMALRPLAILFISHDLRLVQRYCSRIYQLDDGTLRRGQ